MALPTTAKKRETIMKLLKTGIIAIALIGTPLLISACEQKSDLEEGVEEIQDEIDDATTN
ncbi:MAG: hypothetical protein ACPGRX_08780 [Bdellovibrionales bacterium]